MEIAVIAVIALIVLGPARLPEMARSLGKGMREMRGAFSGEGGDDSSRRLRDADEDDDEDDDYDRPASDDEDETKALDLDAKDDFDEDDDLDFSSSSSDVASPGDSAESSPRSTDGVKDDAKPAASA
jgi:TatA/E family protein of Tat protein translocase